MTSSRNSRVAFVIRVGIGIGMLSGFVAGCGVSMDGLGNRSGGDDAGVMVPGEGGTHEAGGAGGGGGGGQGGRDGAAQIDGPRVVADGAMGSGGAAGTDARIVDVSPDGAAVDRAPDASPDVAPDQAAPTPDGSPDTTPDSAPDTTPDSPPVTTVGKIACGSELCSSKSEVCCAIGMNLSCVADSDPCSGGATRSCDGPEDCQGGEACCAKSDTKGVYGAACMKPSSCSNGSPLCHTDADCPRVCCPLTFQGVTVLVCRDMSSCN